MGRQVKRALWLMNHTTLRRFEVPMLIEMGFEVYCPNMFPYDEGNMSASVTREFDSTLTISCEQLDILNKVDFYRELPREIVELINREFDIVFIGFFPEQFRSVVSHFKGIIVFQAFGLAAGSTYTRILEQYVGYSIFESIKKAGKRFVFGQAYENLAEIECELLQKNAVYLPLGLKNAYVNNKWKGTDKRILFVCPRIQSTTYFGNIYKKFKKDFEGFEYVVGGAQPIDDHSDPRILGFVSDEQYEYNMTQLAVMFYHSQENRHLHYHPIEAVKNGMPLIFMANGLLDELGGKNLPGRCETIAEARKKIARILKGDKNFIQEVTQSQTVLLTPFTEKYCKEIWIKAFQGINVKITQLMAKGQETPPKRIAVVLTEGYTGGVLDVTLRLVKALKRGIETFHSNTQLIFAYVNLPVFTQKDYFAPVRDMGIPIRSFEWKAISYQYMKNYCALIGAGEPDSEGQDYYIMDDGMQMFEDCDGFVFSVDRCPGRIFLTKPHVVLVHDYLQRYMTYVYGNCYEDNVLYMARTAVRTLVMSPPTYQDAIMYAGLPESKLELIPLMFELMPELKETQQTQKTQSNGKKSFGGKEEKPEEYFLWSTNLGEHKNHIMAIRALSSYYNEGGRLKCYMTGVGTDLFDPNSTEEGSEYVQKVRNLIRQEALEEHLKFCGNMSKSKYVQTLRQAKFFMHPGLMDNGNMTAVDAASVGVPTISSNYPQMKYYEEYMHLHMRFFDPYSEKSLKNVLLQTEQDYEVLREQLPSRDELQQYTIEETYRKIFLAIEEAFKLNRGEAE